MGGSMGAVVGEKVARAAEAALAERVPLVVVSASGGARMQEGTLALMQLAKTMAALERLRAAHVPYVSVMSDPTTGGVFASYAAMGDVNLAEPNALIGFAGARVGAGTIGQELPPGFQRSEFLYRHGFVDRVVQRADLRRELAQVLRFVAPAHADADAWLTGSAAAGSPPRHASRPRATVVPVDEKAIVWARVQLARNLRRPRILEFIAEIADEFVELHGDRLFGDDEAVVAGFARIEGRRVVVVGQQKGADTEENVRRNFGMPHPEGYRKAMRVMELAERSGLPVVTFVDVPGAHPGPESEERGIAEAIARSVGLMTRLRTPIVTVITGEGGSGGALAIAVGDVVLALENAVYSVISPEGCASILWRTSDEAPTAALAMRMSAIDQQRLGVDRRGHRRARRRRARRSGRDRPAAEGRDHPRARPARADPDRRAGRAALSPVPFARRVHRARGPGADPAHPPASRPGGPPAEPARGRPAGDPRAAPRRAPGRTARPRGRLAHARPDARPATERPPSGRPITRASPGCPSRSCRRSSRSCRRAAWASSRSGRATGASACGGRRRRPRAAPAPDRAAAARHRTPTATSAGASATPRASTGAASPASPRVRVPTRRARPPPVRSGRSSPRPRSACSAPRRAPAAGSAPATGSPASTCSGSGRT